MLLGPFLLPTLTARARPSQVISQRHVCHYQQIRASPRSLSMTRTIIYLYHSMRTWDARIYDIAQGRAPQLTYPPNTWRSGHSMLRPTPARLLHALSDGCVWIKTARWIYHSFFFNHIFIDFWVHEYHIERRLSRVDGIYHCRCHHKFSLDISHCLFFIVDENIGQTT